MSKFKKKDQCLLDIEKFINMKYNYGARDSEDQHEGKYIDEWYSWGDHILKTYSQYQIMQTIKKYKLHGNAVSHLLKHSK